MGIEQVLRSAMPLLGATEAAGALGAALRMRRDGIDTAPELAARIDAVIDVLGLREALDDLGEHELTVLLGLVEGFLSQAGDFAADPGRAGWTHEDTKILLAQGHMSAMLAQVFQRVGASFPNDFAARLQQPGAAFLDVGAGVAALSIAMCRAFAQLRVVAVDPWPPALEIARRQVAAAGLEDRIELREMVAEELADSDAYDLAWVPTFFIPASVLEAVLERTHAALRPDGWVIAALYARPEDPFAAALADLRTVRQGGALLTPQELTAMLTAVGLQDIDVVVDPPVVLVVGRRAAA